MKRRGVRPVFSEPAILENWELIFNVCSFFRVEGGTGNIRPCLGQEVHGVLYQCSADSISCLDDMEDFEISYDRVQVKVKGYSGQFYNAFAYIGKKEKIRKGLHPSTRYLSKMIKGVKEMQLEGYYTSKLSRIETSSISGYESFSFPHTPLPTYTAESLGTTSHCTALAGVVFNMRAARKEYAHLQRFFAGKDMTVFFLKRMESSDGKENLEQVVKRGLSDTQKNHLDLYLHEFNREYELVGKMDYSIHLSRTQPGTKLDFKNPRYSVASRIVLQTAERINDILGHENLGFLSEKRGLVPIRHFPERLPPYYNAWEDIVVNLADYYTSLKLRYIIDQLPVLQVDAQKLSDHCLLRACTVLSMLSHAYYYVRTQPPERGLPPQLLKPWQGVQNRLGRPLGVLSYIDLIVYNWQFKGHSNKKDNFDVSNLDLLFPTVNNPAEQLFYLTQLEILAHCSPIIPSIVRAQEAIIQNGIETLKGELTKINLCLKKITHKSLFNIDPNSYSSNYVSHVIWAKTVAPFAVPFRNNMLGPSGTSSPIFNVIDAFLGRESHETLLGKEIKALRGTYPIFWQKFIDAVSQIPLADYVSKVNDPTLTNLTQEVLDNYAGSNGFLGRHRMKVYGYLEMAFKVGRDMTIGGFAGKVQDKEHEHVDSQLEWSRQERTKSFPHHCYHGYIKSVSKTHDGGSTTVKRVILDVNGLGIRYEPGDRCLILPENSNHLITKTIKALSADGNEKIALTDEWLQAVELRHGFKKFKNLTLENFLRFAQIRPVTSSIAKGLYMVSKSRFLDREIRSQTTTKWELYELLELLARDGFDSRILLEAKPDSKKYLANILPPENFRNYTISSTMDASKENSAKEIHLTVGVVSYPNNVGEVKYGTASRFLTQNPDKQKKISFRIERPARFNLPSDPETPIAMIAGGTGVGAFRAFIKERLKDPKSGEMWLLFFTRSREHFYYQDDFLGAVNSGRLKLFVNFSVENIELDMDKTYANGQKFFYRKGRRRKVGDFFADRRNSRLLWHFLQKKNPAPQIYICGRTMFAKAVHESLQGVLYRNITGAPTIRHQEAIRMLAKLFASGGLRQETFTNAASTPLEERVIQVSELAQKNAGEENWLAIDDVVYDLTNFQHIHPGGQTILRSYFGTDATTGYKKVHNRLDIDVMRDIYRLGKLYHPDFRNKTVSYRGGKFSLEHLYRTWVLALYKVVEMENTLAIDQSLQSYSIIANQAPDLQTAYKTEKAIETHKRFVDSYLVELTNEIIPRMWESVRKIGSTKKLDDEIEKEISNMQAAQGVINTSQILQRKLDQLVAKSNNIGQQEDLSRIMEVLSNLAEADKVCLSAVKQKLVKAVTIFETYKEQVDTEILHFRQIFFGVGKLVDMYWKKVNTLFREDNWSTYTETNEEIPRVSGGTTESLIVNWLLGGTLHLNKVENLISEFAARLNLLVDVNGISFDIHTARSKVAVRNLTWQRGQEVKSLLLSPEKIKTRLDKESPVAKIYGGSNTIRMKLDGEELEYSMGKALISQGCTDYIVFPIEYTRGGRSYVSYTTNRDGGFAEDEIKILEKICPALSRRLEIESYHFFFGFSEMFEGFWKKVSERCKRLSQTDIHK